MTAILFDENWDNVHNVAARDSFLIKHWFDQNLFTLNISLTKFITISQSDQVDS